MAFFDKRYQEDSLENVSEFLDVLGVDETAREYLKLLHNIDTIISYTREEDTITVTIEADGEVVLELPLTLGEEKEITLPDDKGVVTHVTNLEENVLTTTVTFMEKSVSLIRSFDDDGYTMTVSVDGLDVQPSIHYKEVQE